MGMNRNDASPFLFPFIRVISDGGQVTFYTPQKELESLSSTSTGVFQRMVGEQTPEKGVERKRMAILKRG